LLEIIVAVFTTDVPNGYTCWSSIISNRNTEGVAVIRGGVVLMLAIGE
jgi:hypothetical protein